MSVINVYRADITTFRADAIVNATDTHLKCDSGVSRAISKKAGKERLRRALAVSGKLRVGKPIMTAGFDLPSRHIIHVAGPRWIDGKHSEIELLVKTYRSVLNLAYANDFHKVVFPLISTGAKHFPKDVAWECALKTCCDFLESGKDLDMEIVFAVTDECGLEKFIRKAPEAARPEMNW